MCWEIAARWLSMSFYRECSPLSMRTEGFDMRSLRKAFAQLNRKIMRRPASTSPRALMLNRALHNAEEGPSPRSRLASRHHMGGRRVISGPWSRQPKPRQGLQ